jgi:hypothetical protein
MSDEKKLEDVIAENQLLTAENESLTNQNTALKAKVEDQEATIAAQETRIRNLEEMNTLLESAAQESEAKAKSVKKNEVIDHKSAKLECLVNKFYHADGKLYESATAPKNIIDEVLKIEGQCIYKKV